MAATPSLIALPYVNIEMPETSHEYPAAGCSIVWIPSPDRILRSVDRTETKAGEDIDTSRDTSHGELQDIHLVRLKL
jgi:hypothetical protein